MSILKGIKLSGSSESHQLDYESGIGNKPKLVKSFNDLEDKPFYAEDGGTIEILPKDDYEFVYSEDMGLGFAAFAPALNSHLKANETYFVEFDGKTYTCKSIGQEVEEDGAVLCSVFLGNLSIEGFPDTGEPFFIGDIYISDGTSLDAIFGLFETESSTHNVRIYQSNEIIHYLDSKYIKDMYYSTGDKTILFEEREVEFVPMSEGGIQGNGYIHTPSIDIDGRLDVFVKWDGVLYKCTPMVDSDTEESREIYVGNLGFLNQEFNTGEPFLILDSLQGTVFGSVAEGTHKICVYQSDEVVHQIDPKYVDAYTKEETLMLLGVYVDEVNTLLGGED